MLKDLILVVEDNEHVLLNLKLTLEFNNYEVATAKNGKSGLQILKELSRPPDLIISDIMMPVMDGYEFFKAVSENPSWNRIPFVFLTAKSSFEDIRFGKYLGVDDYITKPFVKSDLLACIAGKIARNKKINSINQKIEEKITALKIDTGPSISEEEKSRVIVFLMIWDDKMGPYLSKCHHKDVGFSFSIKQVGVQLFNAIVSIYGQEYVNESQGILLDIKNIRNHGFIYFDSFPDRSLRGGERQFMLSVIAPKINYFESLKIREIFREITPKIKNNQDWDIKSYWEKISDILSTPTISD
ncbi:MAG: response regulator [Candidatus Helarchaeota archaeon]